MWIMKCSASNILWEHHSEADAREYLAVHVIGGEALGFDPRFDWPPPCYAKHEVYDNGKQCTNPGGCNIPYIRADGRRQYVV